MVLSKFTVIQVETNSRNSRWTKHTSGTVRRLYAEFIWLRDALKATNISLPRDLPPSNAAGRIDTIVCVFAYFDL